MAQGVNKAKSHTESMSVYRHHVLNLQRSWIEKGRLSGEIVQNFSLIWQYFILLKNNNACLVEKVMLTETGMNSIIKTS